MEFGGAETPSPVTADTSPYECLSRETWDSREFINRLTAPEEIPYTALPHHIELDKSWHELIHQMVAVTADHGNEVHAVLAGIDRDGPLQSLPIDIDELLMPDHIGSIDNPLFASKIGLGTKEEAWISTIGCRSIPAAIKWQGQTVPMKQVGFLHTHPNHWPFSDGDFLSFGFSEEMKFMAALTQESNGFLLRSDKTPNMSAFTCTTADDFIHQVLRNKSVKQRLRSLWMMHSSEWQNALNEENQLLAKAFKFGLYRGVAGGPIERLA